MAILMVGKMLLFGLTNRKNALEGIFDRRNQLENKV
jgi:hypothetical protein